MSSKTEEAKKQAKAMTAAVKNEKPADPVQSPVGVDQQSDSLAQEKSGAEVKVDPAQNKFVGEFGELMYLNSVKSPKPFGSLLEEERQLWFGRAVAALISLDKMNKMVAPKRVQKDIEYDRNKNIGIMAQIISVFVSGIKTIKCPKCGSNAELRSKIFPCEELAARIWDGGKS